MDKAANEANSIVTSTTMKKDVSIFKAAKNNDIAAVKLVLKSKINLNSLNKYGYAALHPLRAMDGE